MDRFPAHAFAGQAAADDTGSAIVLNDGLALAASTAWKPRTHAVVSIDIAPAARVDTLAAAVDIPAAVPADSGAALRADLTFAPDGWAANGWALDGGEAAQSSDCDGFEQEMAPSPRSVLR